MFWKDRETKTTVQINSKLHHRLKLYCVENKVKIGEFVENLIKDAIKK